MNVQCQPFRCSKNHAQLEIINLITVFILILLSTNHGTNAKKSLIENSSLLDFRNPQANIPLRKSVTANVEHGTALPPTSLSSEYERVYTSTKKEQNDVLKFDSLAKFQSDLSRIQLLPGLSLTINDKTCDSSYIKAWTLADWEYHCKPSPIRYMTHVLSWPKSKTAHNTLPTVCFVVLWTFVISKSAQKFPAFTSSMKFGFIMAFLQAPILFLLTLRTNRALDRFLEARRAWGTISRATRSLMGLICAYIMPIDQQNALLMSRYLAILAWSLREMLTGENDDDIIERVLSPSEANWLLNSQGARPLLMISRLRLICSHFVRGEHICTIPNVVLQEMEQRLYDLECSVGTCSRILTSPIPPTYTRHTSRVLCLYLSLLPLALVGMDVSTRAMIITVMFAAYVLVGIDEICLERKTTQSCHLKKFKL